MAEMMLVIPAYQLFSDRTKFQDSISAKNFLNNKLSVETSLEKNRPAVFDKLFLNIEQNIHFLSFWHFQPNCLPIQSTKPEHFFFILL